ncbi:MAG: Response regulator UvrY [Anaerolineales bacterium]|nr:Response regulator UvrY [Anaerolineales bacterium]
MISVYLVDDQRILRDGLRALLELQRDMRVTGEASNGHEAIEGILSTQPDVALMDVTMPELNGIDATQIIKQKAPKIQIIILSVHSDSEHVYRAFEAGASGYLLKESAGAEVVQAVRAAKAGQRYLSAKISDAMPFRRDLRSPFEALSAREREVLQLTVAGETSAAIAEKLNLSPKTVDTYRSRVLEKLGAKNLPELVRMAIKYGLTPAE